MRIFVIAAVMLAAIFSGCGGVSPRIVNAAPWASEFKFQGYAHCTPGQVGIVTDRLVNQAKAKGATDVLIDVEKQTVWVNKVGVITNGRKVSVVGYYNPHAANLPEKKVNPEPKTVEYNGHDLPVVDDPTMIWRTTAF